jgi:hypothetical protein
MIDKILRYLLIATIIFLAISGVYGGVALILSPSGDFLQISTSFLESTIFNSYLIPGFILLIFLGLFPVFVAYGLITKRRIRWANKINIYKRRHWAWTYSLYTGIILVLWIDIQVMMLGGGYILQSIYAIIGVLIIVLTLTPQLMRFYKKR